MLGINRIEWTPLPRENGMWKLADGASREFLQSNCKTVLLSSPTKSTCGFTASKQHDQPQEGSGHDWMGLYDLDDVSLSVLSVEVVRMMSGSVGCT